MRATKDQIKGGLWGVIVGDALGVPVEFEPRLERKEHPITGMVGNGTYGQKAGTWSDDSSLTLCTVDSLLGGFDIDDMGQKFVRWYKEALWTPYDEVFDIGTTTSRALEKLASGVPPTQSGVDDQWSNGNGSLMRILPVAFTLHGLEEQEKFERVRLASSITHAHYRAIISCYIYVKYVEKLLETANKAQAYIEMQMQVRDLIRQKLTEEEYQSFARILDDDISTFAESEISSSGYVVYTLEAALWSFMTTNSYEEAVLTAVNLGEDTDTTGAVTGGLAGTFYGLGAIPQQWLIILPKRREIENLINRFAEKYGQ